MGVGVLTTLETGLGLALKRINGNEWVLGGGAVATAV
jgi:hypothetical protein